MSDTLFPVEPVPVPATLSAGARRTARAAADIAAGRHPANGFAIDPAHRCGDCTHLVTHRRNKTWFKCPHHRLGMSFSEASDMRCSWPACDLFVQRSA